MTVTSREHCLSARVRRATVWPGPTPKALTGKGPANGEKVEARQPTKIAARGTGRARQGKVRVRGARQPTKIAARGTGRARQGKVRVRRVRQPIKIAARDTGRARQ
jgi:hypothetical protein